MNKFNPKIKSVLPSFMELIKKTFITDKDINNYIKEWDKNNPDHIGILEAEPTIEVEGENNELFF